MRHTTLPLWLPLALLAITGCEATESYNREGTWRPTHVMDANIAMQVANPSVLVRGVEYDPRDSSFPTQAVERYRVGKLRSLPSSSTLSISSSSGGDSGGGGAAGGSGGAAQ